MVLGLPLGLMEAEKVPLPAKVVAVAIESLRPSEPPMMTMVSTWVSVNCGTEPSATLTVKVWLVAVAVAGPVMAPVAAFIARPAGRVPALRLKL